MKAVIPPRPNRRQALQYDKETDRAANIVQRLVVRVDEYRRVVTRDDKIAAQYLGFILLAAITTQLELFVSRA